VILPLTPVDLTEVSQLVSNGVSVTNVPPPQARFDQQSFKAATVIKQWPTPLLVRCSTGDRASAAFAAYLITYGGLRNSDAVTFAREQLALANPQFIAWLEAYAAP
jgi:protein tyrosine phosphatase (PTP) superfamily phosphohydrolase (DUF442 family)